jgi:hypothetical protein
MRSDPPLDVDARRLRYRFQPHPDPTRAVESAIGQVVADYLQPRAVEREDPTIGNEQLIRGIPAVGHVRGAIHRTTPGYNLFD